MTPTFNQEWIDGEYRIDKYRRDEFKKKLDKAIPLFDVFAVTCYVYEHYTGEFPKMEEMSWAGLGAAIEKKGIDDKIKRFLKEYMVQREVLMKYPLLKRENVIRQCLEAAGN